MNMQELNELDLSNIGEWPGVIKAILILILMGGVGARKPGTSSETFCP